MSDVSLANDLVIKSLIAKVARLEEWVANAEAKKPKARRAQVVKPKDAKDYAAFAEMAGICKSVASCYGVTVEDIRRRNHDYPLPMARRDAAVLCADAGHSSSRIGRYFDGRDHSTILEMMGRKRQD